MGGRNRYAPIDQSTLKLVDALVTSLKIVGHSVKHGVDLVHAIPPQTHGEGDILDRGGSDVTIGEKQRRPVGGRFGQATEPSYRRQRDRHHDKDRRDDVDRSHSPIVSHSGPAATEGADLAAVREDGTVSLTPAPAALPLGEHIFATDQLLIMAIVNRTPDSFYDGGATMADDDALAAIDRAIDAGADIVDIGGVKAGPGEEVDPQEELRRVASFVGVVRARHPQVVISVDTWRAEVGRAACLEGADLMNDAWGGVDPGLAEVAAEFGVGLVCTHTGGATPRTRPHRVTYDDVMVDILTRCQAEADRAVAAGVRRERILIDPGHDFGKNTRHSLEATRRLDEMVATGYPVLVSLSRKDFVGETLGIPVPADRLLGTLATTAVSAWLGARVFRVHDVAETRTVLDMVSSLRGDRPPQTARRGLA